MNKLNIILILITLLIFNTTAYAGHTRVNGYYKSNGTYVNGYTRTSPNSTKFDNFSTKGNINPYTFKQGTVNPYNTTNHNYRLNNRRIR